MTLQWRRPDSYHTRSSCGRFSVARINMEPDTWYVAYRWPSLELGAIRLPAPVSVDDRIKAIAEMRALCDAEALTLLSDGDKVAETPEPT